MGKNEPAVLAQKFLRQRDEAEGGRQFSGYSPDGSGESLFLLEREKRNLYSFFTRIWQSDKRRRRFWARATKNVFFSPIFFLFKHICHGFPEKHLGLSRGI